MTAGVSALAGSSVSGDIVTDWNTVYLNTCRAVGGPPCPLARTSAMMHVAMFDALQAIDREYTPMVVKDEDPLPGTSRKAAIAAAAHRVMVHLYPAREEIFDVALADSLSKVENGPGEDQGVALGVAVADKIIADHADDQPFANDTDYVYHDVPGAYQPTYPDFTMPPFSPGWGHCKPWCMLTGAQFRAKRGPLGYAKIGNLLKSNGYAQQFNEVKQYGRRYSRVRTDDQTEIAWFWANDRNGTYKPAGHLLAITQTVSRDHRLGMAENARLFAMVSVALADAGIMAWDQKYLTDVDLWRPITAIRNADTDGNPLTTVDPGWRPLLEFSPPFPGYVSGHASFGGAWAAVMASYFGRDDISFDATTDEPIVTHVVRRYESFSSAGTDDALSRIYLGVHFRCDVEDGYKHGYKMGQTLASTFFRPTCRADISRDGGITTADLSLFTNAYFNGTNAADYNADGDVDMNDVFDFMTAYEDGCN